VKFFAHKAPNQRGTTERTLAPSNVAGIRFLHSSTSTGASRDLVDDLAPVWVDLESIGAVSSEVELAITQRGT
jgi:hypothetical protein